MLLAAQAQLVTAMARKLVPSTPLRLGVRRRLLYEPPQGWRAVPSGLVANWDPPDYPKQRVNLVVAPAEPGPASAHAMADVAGQLAGERERGFELEGEADEVDLLSLSGIVGRRCAYTVVPHRGDASGRRRLELAAYAVAPYVYVMRMEALGVATAAALHHVFLDCARSPGQGWIGVDTLAGEPLAHWVD